MATRVLLPPGLPAEIGRPLLATAERIAQLKPWETMSDLHLIGLRVEGTGELQVASILGALRQVFAIVIYRHDAGLRWIHEIATTGQPPSERDSTLESLDYLKIEWAPKRELRKPDLDTLANARC
ncbi:MAG TPA: hypothetical protein VEC99_11005, partial [Clostridia bacterium]|nr:hypothetical protein [Clostridia bacterium]